MYQITTHEPSSIFSSFTVGWAWCSVELANDDRSHWSIGGSLDRLLDQLGKSCSSLERLVDVP
jgi:hypothetical protein